MKCPWCGVAFNDAHIVRELGTIGRVSTGAMVDLRTRQCPECDEIIVDLSLRLAQHQQDVMVYPMTANRPVPNEVDPRLARDFREAVATLGTSAKASAALSRRIVQDILREQAGVKKSNLESEIDEAIEAGGIPSRLADDLHAIRHVGNFAAHPSKSLHTGEVVEVEPGEAEWLLELIESMFDHYFVQPEASRRRRDALNAKLEEMGKPQLPEPAAEVES